MRPFHAKAMAFVNGGTRLGLHVRQLVPRGGHHADKREVDDPLRGEYD
jgi:hypothetical protein